MTALCVNGHEITPGASFCRTCGARVGAQGSSTAQGANPAPTAAALPGLSPNMVNPPPGLSLPPTSLHPKGGPGTGVMIPPEPEWAPRRGHPALWITIGVAAALAVVGLVLLFTLHKSTTPQTLAPDSNGSPSGQTGTPPTPITTQPTVTQQTAPSAQTEASSVSTLLAASAFDRTAIVNAVDAVSSCGDVQSAESVLTTAAAGRQSLLNQLQDLDLSALQDSTDLTQDLTAAWNNSIASDQSYAAWANDELGNCTDHDFSDPNYQAAQTTDSASTQSKTEFAQLWNPIATTYGLPTVTQSSF
jgi:hypothetical protein